MNNELLVAIPCAYLLDLAIGDPRWGWHPVRLIGRLIERSEKALNTAGANSKLRGIALVVFVIGTTVIFIWGIIILAGFINPFLRLFVSTILIYFSLSIKSLAVEADQVYGALKNRNIGKARNSLSMIVGRDTANLNEKEVIRASVETVAESTMDGIIAPLFYAFLGGPALVWIYKAINTLDSMVGYKNERYIKFGWASAKIDSLVNFIPSKITYLFLSISALLYGKSFINSCRCGLRYFFKGLEHNATVTEAAMAGALKIQLGGLNFYSSAPVSKPLIGKADFPLEARHIQESINLSCLCSLLFLLTGIFFILSGGR